VCFRKIVSIIAVVTAQFRGFDVPEVGGEEVFAEFLNYQRRDSSHNVSVLLK
jgi:hypothetical protein